MRKRRGSSKLIRPPKANVGIPCHSGGYKKGDMARVEYYLRGDFLCGKPLRWPDGCGGHGDGVAKDATQTDVEFVLRDFFDSSSHRRTRMPVAQETDLRECSFDTHQDGAIPCVSANTKGEAEAHLAGVIILCPASAKGDDVDDLFVFVKTIFGNTITVTLGGSKMTDDLMSKLPTCCVEGTIMLSVVLMHRGIPVEPGELLSDLNIKKHTMLRQTTVLLGGTKEAIYQEMKGNSPMAKLLSTLLLTKKLASKCRGDEGVPEPEYEGVSLDSSIVETSLYF